jgi:aspartyl protease family protein
MLPPVEGEPVVQGKDTRVPLGRDGHFWVKASVNGVPVRFLVDTGATLTTLSPQAAQDAGLEIGKLNRRIELRTANGSTTGAIVTLDELRAGNIAARRIEAVVAPGIGDTNVLGMNFLTKLESWRVEGKMMVLVPHHPVPVDSPAAH